MSETLRSSGKVSLAVALSRVLGLFRVSILSRLVGAGALADAFSVAFRIPNLLRDLLAEGALSSAFVPTFTAALKQDGEDAARHLANLALGGLLLLTGALTGLGILFAEQVVRAITAGWSIEKIALTARLTRIMMPILALVSLGAVWMGILNAQRRFVVPAIAPALFNVVSILVGVALLVLDVGGEQALLVWSVGTLCAGIAQALSQLPTLWRMGYRPWPALRGFRAHAGVRRIVRLMLPAVVGVAAVQLNVFVNTRFAASLGDGPVAQLEYAFRIFFLPIGMFGVALATVTTTTVSEEAARGDRAGLIARARESVSAVWLLTAASAVGLAVLAEPVVALLYEGGRFTPEDTRAVAFVLQAYMAGLVPYSMVKVVAPAFYSIDRPRVPLLASVSAVAVNIVFNALTYRTLGAPGLALGTSIGALVNVVILRLAFRRVVGVMAGEGRARQLVWLIAACVALAASVGALRLAFAAALERLQGVISAPAWLWVALDASALTLEVAAGFVVYTALLRAAGFPGAAQLWRLPVALARRVRRRRAPPASTNML